jgi:nitrile hydratase subunit beta
MNGIHDMGGMDGFGPIEVEPDEPVFHQPWEGRVYALRGPLVGGVRAIIERMPPAQYLATSYYEKWLWAKTQNLLANGAFTQAELDERIAYYRAHPQAEPPRRDDPEAAHAATALSLQPVSHRHHTGAQPIFHIGEWVQTKNIHPHGHTRLPRYARGKRCVIVKYYGVQEFNDGLPGESPAPQPLYNVRFEGSELWGESAEANSALYLDMWESYLEAMPTQEQVG